MATKLCKAAKERLALEAHFMEMHNNPPIYIFNPAYDPKKAEANKRKEAYIRDALNEYHKQLKYVPNEKYYDLMDSKELELRANYKG